MLTYSSISVYDHWEAPVYVNWWQMTSASVLLNDEYLHILPHCVPWYKTTRPDENVFESVPCLCNIILPSLGVPVK